jgi:hypothetical protein
MNITYEWRELSREGLLLRITDQDPHYYTTNSSFYYGCFDTEELAIKALEIYYEVHSVRNFVLIKVYN